MRDWRTNRGGRETHPPVEMRFVDMFMAALGSLLFLALILAFLLRYLPPPDTAGHPPPMAVQPLQLLTKVLPPARVNEPYEVVLAYRGGPGVIRWSVPAGTQSVPPGVNFDTAQGIFAGTPSAKGVYRFVIALEDALGRPETRAFDLRVDPAVGGSSRVSVWASVVLLVLLVLMSLIFLAVSRHSDHIANEAEKAQSRGQPTYAYGMTGRMTILDLSNHRAIRQLRHEARNERRMFMGTLGVCFIIGTYIIWALMG